MLDLIAPPPTTPQMGDKPQKVKKLRSTRACISCRIRKIRCDAQERIPCLNCAPLGSTCKFVEPKSRKKKQRMIAPTPPTPPMQWPPSQGGYYTNPYALVPQYYPYAAPAPPQAPSMSSMTSMGHMQRLSPMAQHPLGLQQPLPYQGHHHYGQVKLTPQQLHQHGLPLSVQQLPGYSQQSYGTQAYPAQLYPTSNPSLTQGKTLPPPQGVQTQLQQPFQAQPQLYGGATAPLLLLAAQTYAMPPPQQLQLAQGYAMPPPVAYFPPHPYYYGQVVQQTTPPQPTPYLTPLDLRAVLLPQFPLYLSPLGHKSREMEKK